MESTHEQREEVEKEKATPALEEPKEAEGKHLLGDIDSKKFTLYKRRWVILAIFSLISMTNEIIWISLSSITSIVQEYYRVDSIAVNWLSMIYMLLYIFVIATSFILDKYGLRFTILVGGMLNAIGSCFRAIGANRDGFPLAFLGNTSAALAQCFILFIPPRLASVWFGEHERATASSIGVLMNMLGVALGFLMGGTMVPSDTSQMDCGVRYGMYNMLLSQAVFCSLLAFGSILLVQSAPPTPASRSQALVLKLKDRKLINFQINDHVYDTKDKTNSTPDKEAHNSVNIPTFYESLFVLVKDKSFHLVCQAYGFYFGLFAAYNTILNQMVIARYPGKEKEIGYMGFAAVICGLFAIFFSGIWLDKTKRYKSLSIAIFTTCAVTLLIFTLLLTYHNSFMLMFISFCVFGFFSYPYMSAGLEHAAEITYPIPEGTTSGILLLVGNIYGIILTYVVGAAIEKVGGDVGGYVMVGAYVLGILMVSFNSAPLKRSEADKQHGFDP